MIQTNMLVRKSCYFYHYLIILFFILAIIQQTEAQTNTVLPFLKKNVRITGQTSTYGELYTANGISGRRPPSTLRLSLTPVFSFSNFFSVSTNILLSTEGSSARQNINILGLHPAWKWGRAHLGDYTDNFSKYSFNGVNVKGAEIDLFPGNFRFTAGGGQTKRAVEGILVNESFDQSLFSARLGYGKQKGSHFNFIFVKVKDDPSSLKKPEDWNYDYVIPDTLETELDTIWVEPPYNPLSVTPQENMVIGFAADVHLLKNRLIWKIEGNGSGFTRDLNAAAVQMDSIVANGVIKDIFERIFTPRAGSSFDYALNTQIGLNLKNFRLKAGFRRLGPGYYSLGIPSTVNDRQDLILNTTFKVGRNHVRMSWNRLSDNLLKQKLQTNIRNQFQASVNTVTSKWRSNVSLRFLGMDNKISSDSLGWNFNNIIFSTNQSLILSRQSTLRQIGLQYTFQRSDKDLNYQLNTAKYHTLNLTANLRFVNVLSLNTSVGLSYRNSDDENKYYTQVYSLRLNHNAMHNRLFTSLYSISSMVRDTRMLRTGLTSNYRLSKDYRVTLNLSYNNFTGARDFTEFRSSLMLSRKF